MRRDRLQLQAVDLLLQVAAEQFRGYAKLQFRWNNRAPPALGWFVSSFCLSINKKGGCLSQGVHCAKPVFEDVMLTPEVLHERGCPERCRDFMDRGCQRPGDSMLKYQYPWAT